MGESSTRQSKALIALAVLTLAGFGAAAARRFYDAGKAVQSDLVITGRPEPSRALENVSATASLPAPRGPHSKPGIGPGPPPKPATVTVHAAGAVKKPGVYVLPADSRVEDAIKAAGGPAEGADPDAINRAALAEDGARIYVPKRGESPAPPNAEPTASSSHPSHGRSSGKLTTPGSGTVNINAAGAEELQRLPGVGPAMAARIITYRKEAGRFGAPEDLMSVSGIGEKRFANMKPFVRVR